MRPELGVVLSILIRTVSVSEKAVCLSALFAHCMSLASAWGEAGSTLPRVIDLVIVPVIIRTIAFIFVIAILIDLIIPIIFSWMGLVATRHCRNQTNVRGPL